MSAESDISSGAKQDNHEDAADFLLSNSKYHDCYLVIGNPKTDHVEVLGVVSSNLMAHSPVFREMLDNHQAKHPPEPKIHVTDVSPSSFKLMLRYMYGGKLPKMTAVEAAKLALCADKFKVYRLLKKTFKHLKPTSAEDVFPALICVSHIDFPDLETLVSKIIQQETEKVFQNIAFLDLNEMSVIYILKQNSLNIDELEVWKNVFRWAEHKVELNPKTSIRECLVKTIGHVRFLTLSVMEIAEYILPTNVLTPEEFVDLTLTITRKKQELESSILCKISERRNFNLNTKLPEEKCVPVAENKTGSLICEHDTKKSCKSCYFETAFYYEVTSETEKIDSTFHITPTEAIEVVSLKCASRKCVSTYYDSTYDCGMSYATWYKISCEIKVEKRLKSVIVNKEVIIVHGTGYGLEHIIIPLKLESGQPLIMNPGETWTFSLKFDDKHPALQIFSYKDGHFVDFDTTIIGEHFSIKYDSDFHVLGINYRTHLFNEK